MKLTSVELHPHGYSERVVLSFKDPQRKNPYNVKGITGLDADSIVPRYYGVGGNKYYELSPEKREVVLRIALNPRFDLGESYSSLRDFIYKSIASTRTGLIHIHFMNGTEMVSALNGFITKVEAPHFNKEQEVQITVSCDDARLRGLTLIEPDVSGLDPALTTITDDISTAPHGFMFELETTSAVASVTITDPTETGWSFMVTPSGGFLVGDILKFSSEYGDKQLSIIRGGNTIPIAEAIQIGSIWPIMFPGENQLSLTNPTAFSWNSISYYPAYWGV